MRTLREAGNAGSTVVKAAIVLFWVAMMAALVVRETRLATLGDVGPGIASGDLASDEAWYGVYFVKGEGPDAQRTKIGYSHLSKKPSHPGYILEEVTRLKLTVQKTQKTIRTKLRAAVDDQYRLFSLDFELDSDMVDFKITGEVKGDELRLDVTSGSSTRKEVIPIDEAPYVPLNMADRIAAEGLELGKTYTVPYFDPSSMSMNDLTVTVASRDTIDLEDGPRDVFLVKSEFVGVPIETWIDEQGHMLKEMTASMMTVRETRETALMRGWGEGVPMDIIDMAAVKVDKTIDRPRRAKSLAVKLSGVSLAGMPIDDARQSLAADGTLTVEKEAVPQKGGYEIPYKEEEYAQLLEPSTTLQSDDKDIIMQAREIVDGETGALAASRKLFNWVYETLDKEPVVSVPSAKDVLDIKRGDCNEHAVLFAALARAVGIPAKILVGVVYNDGSFYYHAWNSVWVGEWIAVDATFGQFPADATHLKFLEGDLDQQVAVARLIGKLQIEVLDYR